MTIGVQAQYTSRLGRFQVDNIRGCAPFRVTITDANLKTVNQCTGSFPCGMYFGAAPCVDPSTASCPNQFTFTYNTPGTYLLQIYYPSIGPDDITITVDQNIQPAFEVYTCAGSQVKINITDKTYDSYQIDFNSDGIIENTIPSGNNQTVSYNYGANGNYNISVKGKKVNAANNCSATQQALAAVTSLPAPVFNSLDAIDASTLQLGFTPQTNIQYQVEFAINSSTNFQVYKNLYSVNTLSVPNLSVDNNYYCFRLSSHDACTNTNTSSIPVCSQNFDLNLVSGKNQLAWQTAGSISNIDVERNASSYKTLAGSARTFDDVSPNVICKTDYCYKLKATYSNGTVSTSLQKCGTTFFTSVPTSINNASTVINGNQAQITWVPDPLYPTSSYTVFKATNAVDFSLVLGNTPTPDFTDNSYNPDNTNCYQVNYIDNCGNVSANGQPICPVRLVGSLNDKNYVFLQWSAYEGWKQGVKNYTIQKYNAAGTLISSITVTGTSYDDDQDDLTNQVVSYTIIANPIEVAMPKSISNTITVVKRINLYSPTAFNPDSRHTENSSFVVKGHYLASLTLQIFDRWGTLVYSSTSDEPWDGKKEGAPMPTATYVWTAQGTDYSGREFKQAGTVLLIRHKN